MNELFTQTGWVSLVGALLFLGMATFLWMSSRPAKLSQEERDKLEKLKDLDGDPLSHDEVREQSDLEKKREGLSVADKVALTSLEKRSGKLNPDEERALQELRTKQKSAEESLTKEERARLEELRSRPTREEQKELKALLKKEEESEKQAVPPIVWVSGSLGALSLFLSIVLFLAASATAKKVNGADKAVEEKAEADADNKKSEAAVKVVKPNQKDVIQPDLGDRKPISAAPNGEDLKKIADILKQGMDNGFATIQKQVDEEVFKARTENAHSQEMLKKHGERLDEVDRRINRYDERQDQVQLAVNQLQSDLSNVKVRQDTVEKRVTGLEEYNKKREEMLASLGFGQSQSPGFSVQGPGPITVRPTNFPASSGPITGPTLSRARNALGTFEQARINVGPANTNVIAAGTSPSVEVFGKRALVRRIGPNRVVTLDYTLLFAVSNPVREIDLQTVAKQIVNTLHYKHGGDYGESTEDRAKFNQHAKAPAAEILKTKKLEDSVSLVGGAVSVRQ